MYKDITESLDNILNKIESLQNEFEQLTKNPLNWVFRKKRILYLHHQAEEHLEYIYSGKFFEDWGIK